MGLFDYCPEAGPRACASRRASATAASAFREILDAHQNFSRAAMAACAPICVERTCALPICSQADLTGALLDGANLEGAKFRQAKLDARTYRRQAARR